MKKSTKENSKTTSSSNGKDNDSEEYEYFTPQEIEALDKYKEFTDGYFDDEELYDVIIKYNYDDEKIKEELKDKLRSVARGDEYKWHEHGKSILYHNFI